MKAGTMPAVPIPPRQLCASTSRTEMPCLAAVSAAAMPAGPPPATRTSMFVTYFHRALVSQGLLLVSHVECSLFAPNGHIEGFGNPSAG